MSDTHIDINRYPGVKPFSSKEEFLFFGRETDLEALNSLIFVKQIVVLYGKSGYGKSSLINAGIIPRLKEKDVWVYFSIRFNNYSEKEAGQNLSPLQTVKQRFSENTRPGPGNILDTLMPGEDSFWYWIKQSQLQTGKTNFILFFDQFEELFTYSKEQVAEFSDQLSQLLYTTLPIGYKKKAAALDETNPVSPGEHDFLYEKPEIKVIFSIRSDRLSLLNILKDKHPLILENCYALDALDISDAKKAITEPAKLPKVLGFKTSEFNYTEAAVDKILKTVANPQDGKIEAATLQIICRFVEDTLVDERKYTEIDENLLGDITDIFQQYYQGILNKLDDKQKNDAQHLIEDQLIEGNRRNPLSASYIQAKFGLSDSLLAQLEQSSLLRKERDAAGRILYEVSHDTLIAAINKVADSRRKQEEAAKRATLEQQIEETKKRAEELLNLNKKAKTRSMIAIGLALVCIFFTVIAILFWQRAKKSQYNSEIATATLCIDRGDLFLENVDTSELSKTTMQAFSEAKRMYDSASGYLAGHYDDSLLAVIKDKINFSNQKITQCQQKLSR